MVKFGLELLYFNWNSIQLPNTETMKIILYIWENDSANTLSRSTQKGLIYAI